MNDAPEADPREPAAPARNPALLNRLLAAWADPSGRTTLIGAGLSIGLLGLLFASNLRHFLLSWSTDENYSHGFLVPFISLYLANLAAERRPIAVKGGVGLGLVLLVSAVATKLATVVVVVGTLGDLALVAALGGLCALLLGSGGLRRYWFAIAFLLFMIPMPVALYTMIASPLQLLVSRIASVVLNATGVPVLTEGNMMTLPGGVQMFVAEACSGMRQLTGFLALTAAVAYLTTRPFWYRAAVVAAAVPIAMTANVARVALTGYIMYYVNPRYASGAYHTIEGLLMLGFGLALLRGLCAILDQVAELFPPDPTPPSPDRAEIRPRPSRAEAEVEVEAEPSTRAERPLLTVPSAPVQG